MANEADRTLFINRLHEKVTEKLLYELFVQAGPVQKVHIKKDEQDNPKFGFVTFQHSESVPYSLTILQGVCLFERELGMKPRDGSVHSQAAQRGGRGGGGGYSSPRGVPRQRLDFQQNTSPAFGSTPNWHPGMGAGSYQGGPFHIQPPVYHQAPPPSTYDSPRQGRRFGAHGAPDRSNSFDRSARHNDSGYGGSGDRRRAAWTNDGDSYANSPRDYYGNRENGASREYYGRDERSRDSGRDRNMDRDRSRSGRR